MVGGESTITYSFYSWIPDKTYLKGDGRARIRDELLNSLWKYKGFALGLDLNLMEAFKNFEQPISRKPISEFDVCAFYQKDPCDFIIDYPKIGKLIYHSTGKKFHFL